MLIRRAPFLVLACVLALRANAVKNIFDDDWTPPARTTKPAPTIKPVSKPIPPANADTTTTQTTPATDPAPTIARAQRLPIPTSSEQTAIRKVMREVFASQLADRTPAGRRKLSESLFAQADKSAGIPAERYVVLAAAYEACVEAADLLNACRAADELAGQFDVDPLSVKAAAVSTVGALPPAQTRDSANANIRAALEVAKLLAAAEDYPAAIRVCQAVSPMLAGAEPETRTRLQARLKEYNALKDASVRIAPQVEKLKTDPDDPAANLAVGKFHCLLRNDWRAGLPLLAKSNDPALKDLATRELAPPKESEAIAAIAEAWWEVATKQTEAPAKASVAAHCADLYRQAIPGLDGLRLELAKRRLAAAGALSDGAGSSPAAALGSKSTTTVMIPADKEWQPTIQVKAGDVLTFSATGLVTTDGGEPHMGPDGKLREGRMWGRLRGRINDGSHHELFMLGANARHVAGLDGELSLRADDRDRPDDLRNNRGEFKVVITRTLAPPHPTAIGRGDQFLLPATDLVCRVMKAGAYDVSAEGEWSVRSDGPLYGAGGKEGGTVGTLIAKFAESEFVVLGKSGRLTVSADGVISFKIRDPDSSLPDNRGSVSVTIRPAK